MSAKECESRRVAPERRVFARRLEATLRCWAIVILIAGTVGCATQSGSNLALLSAMSPPTAGTGRIVVIRTEKGFVGFGDQAFSVALDGHGMGELMTGGFVTADRPPGRHQLSAEYWDIPGATRVDVAVAAGRTYYFRAALNSGVHGVYAVATLSGAAGLAARGVAFGGDHGAVDLTPVSEAEAKSALAAAEKAK